MSYYYFTDISYLKLSGIGGEYTVKATFKDVGTYNGYHIYSANATADLRVPESGSGTLKLVSMTATAQNSGGGLPTTMETSINKMLTYGSSTTSLTDEEKYSMGVSETWNCKVEFVITLNKITPTKSNDQTIKTEASTEKVDYAFDHIVTTDNQELSSGVVVSRKAYIENLIDISKLYAKYKTKTTTVYTKAATLSWAAGNTLPAYSTSSGEYTETSVSTSSDYTGTEEITSFTKSSTIDTTSYLKNSSNDVVQTATFTSPYSGSVSFTQSVTKVTKLAVVKANKTDETYVQKYSGDATFDLYKYDSEEYGYVATIFTYSDESTTILYASDATNLALMKAILTSDPIQGATLFIGANLVCTVSLSDDDSVYGTFLYTKTTEAFTGTIVNISYKLIKETSDLYIDGYQQTNVGEPPYYLVPSDYIDSETGEPISTLTKNVLEDVCVGFVLFGGIDSNGSTLTNGRVVLFKNPSEDINYDLKNPSTDTNLIIKFPHYVSGYADKINKMTFGQLFDNRLFLSGNSDIKNLDYHSDINSDDENDLTYFSDLSYCAYGSDATKLVGYDVFSDGDLIAFKEDSKLEPTMYYRTVAYMTATNSAGATVYDTDGNTLTEEQYPRYVLNQSGEGALTKDLICNYLGDTLLATKTGIKKLNTKSVSSNQHTDLVDVSKWINPKILKEDYSNAKLYTFERRLIVQTSRGIYIGERDLTTDDYNYEYFFQDIQTKDMFEYDGELYFIDSNNILSKFTECEDNAKRIDTKLINLKSASINTSNYTLNVENTIQTNIVEMLDNGYSIQLVDSIGVTYKDDYHSTQILDENGSNKTINYTDQELFIVYDTTDSALHLKNRVGDALTTDIVSSITTIDLTDKYGIAKGNVSAYYITKPFTFGNVNYQKTIQSYTIANDVALNSSINLEYLATNQLQIMTKQNVSSGGSDSMGNFKSSSFDKIQFTYDNLPHIYTRRLKIPRVNYIKFKFSNNDYYNAVLSQLTMTYITGQPNPKGVK